MSALDVVEVKVTIVVVVTCRHVAIGTKRSVEINEIKSLSMSSPSAPDILEIKIFVGTVLGARRSSNDINCVVLRIMRTCFSMKIRLFS